MNRPPLSRLAVYAIGGLVAIDLFVHLFHHERAAPHTDTAVVNLSTTVTPAPAEPPQTNESAILAACHPHLRPNAGSVPNINVSDVPNPAAARFKVRFWVDGDGFVTQAVAIGTTTYSAADQEAALDYLKIVTFLVPNTPECHARKMEMNGLFLESRSSIGEWETILDLYPRYSFDNNRLVQRR